MEKILLPIIVLIVGVSLSAFTPSHPVVKGGSATTQYLFFEVVNGQVDTGSPLNEEPMTIEEFQAQNPVSCPSGNNADCVRAWEQGHSPSSTGAGDYTIRKL